MHFTVVSNDEFAQWGAAGYTWAELPSGSLVIRVRTSAEDPADGEEVARYAPGRWDSVTASGHLLNSGPTS